MKTRKSQIWVETVIYTLIGISIIGIVLGIVKPQIDKERDKISIRQSIDSLNYIDAAVSEVKYTGAGNSRPIALKISKSKLFIDGENDSVRVSIDSKYEYSEPGSWINIGGNIKAKTSEKGKNYNVELIIDYLGKANITYNSRDTTQIFQPAPTPYDLWIKNNGVANDLVKIDFY